MILCVTPNPAIDRTLLVDALHVGEVHRAEKSLMAAGGKGLNVARTIRALGGEPFCMGLAGGHAGNLLAELAEREGLPARWTRMKNETRTCVIVVERGRDATVVNELGAEVSAEEYQAFLQDVWAQAEQAQQVCVSGSLSPGFSLDDYAVMLRRLVERKKSVWVDTSGAALKSALDVRGVNIKVNAAELGDALGMNISDAEQAIAAGRQALTHGCGEVVVQHQVCQRRVALEGGRDAVQEARANDAAVAPDGGDLGQVQVVGMGFAGGA
jgi:1-phosphofructokinase family hexose kinase